MAKLLPGYKKLPGSARRYRTPSGKTISRRQYENLRYKKAGFSNWSEVQRLRKNKSYPYWLSRAKETTGMSTMQLNDPDSEFNYLLAKAADDDFSKNATGSFHDFLVFVGYRDERTDWDVGETP